MGRILDEHFVKDLLSGELKECLEYVKKDHTLDLQIRENYINIYYRGGNALKISKTSSSYNYELDAQYLKLNSVMQKDEIHKWMNQKNWNNYFPKVKQAMDFHFSEKRAEEREFQQLVVRENNQSSIANDTDYFIIDVEYDNRNKARFDLIAVNWPSESSKRKCSSNFKPKLMIIEMKYGDNSLSRSAGIEKHWNDFHMFTSSKKDLNNFKDEMISLFKQKRDLGLIPCLDKANNSNEINEFAEKVELLFLIANHDPASSVLKKELSGAEDIEASLIISSFMGYGIYDNYIRQISQFKGLLSSVG